MPVKPDVTKNTKKTKSNTTRYGRNGKAKLDTEAEITETQEYVTEGLPKMTQYSKQSS